MSLLTLLWLALVPLLASAPQSRAAAGATTAASVVVAAAQLAVGDTHRSGATPDPTLARSAPGGTEHALHSASIQAPVPLARTTGRDPTRVGALRSVTADPPSPAPCDAAARVQARPDTRLHAVAAHGRRPPYLPAAPPIHG